MKVDFKKFERSLPYSSELYGIYQPLLGWRSRIRKLDLAEGIDSLKRTYIEGLRLSSEPRYRLPGPRDKRPVRPFEIELGEVAPEPRSLLSTVDSIVARKVEELVAASGFEPAAWGKYTSAASLEETLRDARDEIQTEVKLTVAAYHETGTEIDTNVVISAILERESSAAGALGRLGAEHSPAEIAELLKPSEALSPTTFFDALTLITPAHSDLVDATISPIGLVRLYRQYFFEFDTFLGPPVQHLWLSPGGTVELVEASTRRTLVERETEQTVETIDISEKSSTAEDELSDAVRSENGSNTKLGVTVSATGGYDVGFVDGTTTVGSSFNVDESSKEAREHTHRSLRQQTETLSSEIRKSFKSTFKTVTESTDTQSRRYVINNTTKVLANYELRRKMRQVGVQVQDYGLHLCWQAYVDNPGDELGVAKLVHVASPADLQGLKEPDAPVMPEPEIRSPSFPVRDIHFGVPKLQLIDVNQFHVVTGKYQLTPPKPGYVLSRVEVALTGEGGYATLRAYPENQEEATASKGPGWPVVEMEKLPTGDAANPSEASVRSVVLGFQLDTPRLGDGHNYYWHVDVTVIWKPSRQLQKDVETAYKSALATYTAGKERAFKEQLDKAARDRVKAASSIKPRKFEELREEERIVIYRGLIRKLLEVAGITAKDPRVRHVFAELVQSMFDVDKMLYFVAPEWWMPRPVNYSHQNIGLHDPAAPPPKPGVIGSLGKTKSKVLPIFDRESTVDWGGAGRKSSYYIAEGSESARMGSSLGWLLQLDGDNLRNAFLNAPWVKAVMPIRAGHEWKALEWLSSDPVEGSEGLEDSYQATDASEKIKILAALKNHVFEDAGLNTLYDSMADAEEIRIIDAIRYLIVHVQERHAQSLAVITSPDEPAMSYLPTDEVFERGFDPLIGGFKASGTTPFKVFDQWVEVLPTDQIVPVEVKYDPKTGMQT